MKIYTYTEQAIAESPALIEGKVFLSRNSDTHEVNYVDDVVAVAEPDKPKAKPKAKP